MPLLVARSGVSGGRGGWPPAAPPLTPLASGPPHPLPSMASAVDLSTHRRANFDCMCRKQSSML